MTKARDNQPRRANARSAGNNEGHHTGNTEPNAIGALDAKPESKTKKVVALLKRAEGASLQELVAATAWQPHTTRAALTGLKKKGHQVSSDKLDGVRRYRMAAA